MADCRIVNQNVASSVTNIDNLATKYANAGTELQMDRIPQVEIQIQSIHPVDGPYRRTTDSGTDGTRRIRSAGVFSVPQRRGRAEHERKRNQGKSRSNPESLEKSSNFFWIPGSIKL